MRTEHGLLVAAALFVAAFPARALPGDVAAALDRHIAALKARDLSGYVATLTTDENLRLVLPDGRTLPTRSQIIAMHREWFTDPGWSWDGELVHAVMGEDMATVLMRFHYRSAPDATARAFWMTLVFRLESGEWRVVHDHASPIQGH